MKRNSLRPASWKIRFSSALSVTRLVITMSLRSNTASGSRWMSVSTSRTIVGVSACARETTSARTGSGIASHSPGWYSAITSRVMSSVALRIGSSSSLRDQVGIEARDDLLRRDQVAGHRVDGDAGHPRRAPRHDALPAEVGLDADELERLEHHLDRDELGDVADQRRDERDAEVDVPVVDQVLQRLPLMLRRRPAPVDGERGRDGSEAAQNSRPNGDIADRLAHQLRARPRRRASTLLARALHGLVGGQDVVLHAEVLVLRRRTRSGRSRAAGSGRSARCRARRARPARPTDEALASSVRCGAAPLLRARRRRRRSAVPSDSAARMRASSGHELADDRAEQVLAAVGAGRPRPSARAARSSRCAAAPCRDRRCGCSRPRAAPRRSSRRPPARAPGGVCRMRRASLRGAAPAAAAPRARRSWRRAAAGRGASPSGSAAGRRARR